MNPYLIIGFVIALGLATASGFSGGDHYRGLQDQATFQTERNGWKEQQDALVAAHQKALADATAERDTLQRYVSNTLAPKYAALDAVNKSFRRELNDRSEQHAKELPADDHACDLPPGMLDDWKQSNAGPRGGEGPGSAAGGGVDAALPGASATGGSVAGATQPQPSPGH